MMLNEILEYNKDIESQLIKILKKNYLKHKDYDDIYHQHTNHNKIYLHDRKGHHFGPLEKNDHIYFEVIDKKLYNIERKNNDN